MTTFINVTVVYALAGHQEVITIKCPPGTTLKEAIIQSKICQRFRELDVDNIDVGVYGFKQNLTYRLCDNDRVEIYRPLLMSPTEARRLRANSRS